LSGQPLRRLPGRRLRPAGGPYLLPCHCADRQPEPPAQSSGNTLLDWTVKYGVPLLGTVGLVLYGMLRLAYVFFYVQLRATPQEVGYGYAEILSSQLIGTIELVLLLAAVLLVLGLGADGLRRATVRPATPRAPYQGMVIRLARWSGLAAVVLVLTLLPGMAWLQGTEARHGYTVRNVYLAHTVRIPVLAVQAVPAVVAWTNAAAPAPLDLRNRHCLLYLGQADGTTVFYDVTTRESLRLPSSGIVVSVPNTDGVPVGC